MKTDNSLQVQHEWVSPSTCKVCLGLSQTRKSSLCLGYEDKKQVRCSARSWISSPCIPTCKSVCYSQCNCATFPTETSQGSYNLPANKAEPR